MLTIQFDVKKINQLKHIFVQLREREQRFTAKEAFSRDFKEATEIELLLMQQELLTGDYSIGAEDIVNFSVINSELNQYMLPADDLDHLGHPVRIMLQENKAMQSLVTELAKEIDKLEQKEKLEESDEQIQQIQQRMRRLGAFHNHYNRKQKLIFPILERYGHSHPG